MCQEAGAVIQVRLQMNAEAGTKDLEKTCKFWDCLGSKTNEI